MDQQPIHRNVVKPARQELDADVPKSSPSCATSYPSYGTGRSRRNLTEVNINSFGTAMLLRCFLSITI